MKGIRFGNYHSYDDFSLILSHKEIGTPTPKTETIEIPGGDGVLDLSEFFGEVKYNNRQLMFEFSTIIPKDEFLTLFTRVQNALHGQRMQIVLDEDADWYYTGRISVSPWKAEKNIGKLTIDCDCDPYKLKNTVTKVSQNVTSSATIKLTNSRKRVVPTITTNAQMTIAFGNYRGTFNAGTFVIPELELHEGENTVTVTGTGNIAFSYREGAL